MISIRGYCLLSVLLGVFQFLFIPPFRFLLVYSHLFFFGTFALCFAPLPPFILVLVPLIRLSSSLSSYQFGVFFSTLPFPLLRIPISFLILSTPPLLSLCFYPSSNFFLSISLSYLSLISSLSLSFIFSSSVTYISPFSAILFTYFSYAFFVLSIPIFYSVLSFFFPHLLPPFFLLSLLSLFPFR